MMNNKQREDLVLAITAITICLTIFFLYNSYMEYNGYNLMWSYSNLRYVWVDKDGKIR